MLLLSIFFVLTSHKVVAYSVNPTNHTEVDWQQSYRSELRRHKEEIEVFGKKFETPEWLSDVSTKTKDFWAGAFGKEKTSSRRVSFIENLKKDESARIRLAIYLNLFVLVLVYVFITFKLLLQSVHESQEDRRKRKTFRSHRAFDAPDYNLPLAAIARRKATAPPLTVENPLTDFVEMAREVSEDSDQIYDDNFDDEEDEEIKKIKVMTENEGDHEEEEEEAKPSTSPKDEPIYDRVATTTETLEESF